MTSREARNGEMRLEILKSAVSAFRRRGYYGASVGEIAGALHMTKGNLYYYFKVPAQPVDATPSSQLIRQHFLTENRFVRLYSIRP